jgi:hypothetical protein
MQFLNLRKQFQQAAVGLTPMQRGRARGEVGATRGQFTAMVVVCAMCFGVRAPGGTALCVFCLGGGGQLIAC